MTSVCNSIFMSFNRTSINREDIKKKKTNVSDIWAEKQFC